MFTAADDNSSTAGTIDDDALDGVDLVTLTGVTDVTTLADGDIVLTA